MILTSKEINIILDKVNDGNFGYSKDPDISRLQGKLSIMLEMALNDKL